MGIPWVASHLHSKLVTQVDSMLAECWQSGFFSHLTIAQAKSVYIAVGCSFQAINLFVFLVIKDQVVKYYSQDSANWPDDGLVCFQKFRLGETRLFHMDNKPISAPKGPPDGFSLLCTGREASKSEP